MDAFFAQISTTPWPLFFALFAGFIGVVGAISALIAQASTSRDRALIKRSEIALTSNESWDGAHSYSEHELSKWLQKRGIPSDSGVADIVRACWSGWIGSRATSLTELHVLVSRRERSKLAARLSGGIAALLLIIGIVGTLSSVKPVLKAFQFRISTPEGEMPISDAPALSNVAESTELVNTLMHNLGDAFLPSLVALIATIFVVAFRGMYSLSLNHYTLELDRFAMGTVMPQYRPRSIADEYAEVRATFAYLAKTIADREENFEKVVSELEKLVNSIEPALSGLEKGIAKMATAGDGLASKANSMATTLSRMLGKKSPLYGAVYGFEEVFERTNDKIEQISVHIKEITTDHEKARAHMTKTLEEISGTIEGVQGDHKEDRDAVRKTVDTFKALIADLPDKTISQVRESFDSGIKTMHLKLDSSLEDQKNESAATHRGILADTRATLDIINETLTETAGKILESSKAIPATLEQVESSLDLAKQKLTEATDAVPSVIERIDSTLSMARDRLDEAAKTIPSALDRVEEIVVKKSEVEVAAVESIRSVAEEAMASINDRNRGVDRGRTSAVGIAFTPEAQLPQSSFSDDQEDPEGSPKRVPETIHRGKKSSKKGRHRAKSSIPEDSSSAGSSSTSNVGLGTMESEPRTSYDEVDSGSEESPSPTEHQEDDSEASESEPSDSPAQDSRERGFFSKIFRRI
jgi:ABC-type transporter Mla subunit MlaD